MHQTRQFTKRRPQSPLLNQQQQSVDGLQVGVSKPILPRSGLAIQNNAPIHVTRSFSKTVTEQHDHDHVINCLMIQQGKINILFIESYSSCSARDSSSYSYCESISTSSSAKWSYSSARTSRTRSWSSALSWAG
jgi:hypothetical protein